jgi:Spy/CpxP family protein refolding chaperone
MRTMAVAALAAAATAGALAGAGALHGRVLAHDGASGPHGGTMAARFLEHVHAFFQELQLTSEQRAQAHTVLMSHRDEFHAGLGRLKTAHQALHDAVTRDGDEAAIKAAAGQVGAAVAELAAIKAKAHQELRALLTPDQRDKAEAMHERMIGRMQGLHGGFRAPHGGPAGAF